MKYAGVTICTECKWMVSEELGQAISQLHLKEILARTQVSWAGLARVEPVQSRSKATREQSKTMVVEEASQVELRLRINKEHGLSGRIPSTGY